MGCRSLDELGGAGVASVVFVKMSMRLCECSIKDVMLKLLNEMKVFLFVMLFMICYILF